MASLGESIVERKAGLVSLVEVETGWQVGGVLKRGSMRCVGDIGLGGLRARWQLRFDEYPTTAKVGLTAKLKAWRLGVCA